MLSFSNVTKSELSAVAKQIAAQLTPLDWFNVSMIGEMGVGKTTFSGYLLHELGVPAEQPVTSPTFTYLNEYLTPDGKLLGHMDIYRSETLLSLEDLGASDQRVFWGLLVEWPEKLAEPVATHELRIAFGKEEGSREIEFKESACG